MDDLHHKAVDTSHYKINDYLNFQKEMKESLHYNKSIPLRLSLSHNCQVSEWMPSRHWFAARTSAKASSTVLGEDSTFGSTGLFGTASVFGPGMGVL